MALLRRAWRYLRHDAPEILWPSSLPDAAAADAGAPAARRGVVASIARLRAGSRAYFDTWKKEADGRSEAPPPPPLISRADAVAALSAASTSADALRPALKALYETRVSAYRDAVFAFGEGYREGVARGAVGAGGGGATPAPAPPPPPPATRKRGRPRKVVAARPGI